MPGDLHDMDVDLGIGMEMDIVLGPGTWAYKPLARDRAVI